MARISQVIYPTNYHSVCVAAQEREKIDQRREKTWGYSMLMVKNARGLESIQLDLSLFRFIGVG